MLFLPALQLPPCFSTLPFFPFRHSFLLCHLPLVFFPFFIFSVIVSYYYFPLIFSSPFLFFVIPFFSVTSTLLLSLFSSLVFLPPLFGVSLSRSFPCFFSFFLLFISPSSQDLFPGYSSLIFSSPLFLLPLFDFSLSRSFLSCFFSLFLCFPLLLSLAFPFQDIFPVVSSLFSLFFLTSLFSLFLSRSSLFHLFLLFDSLSFPFFLHFISSSFLFTSTFHYQDLPYFISIHLSALLSSAFSSQDVASLLLLLPNFTCPRNFALKTLPHSSPSPVQNISLTWRHLDYLTASSQVM